MHISEALARLRKERGLTQSDVAAFLSERYKSYTYKNVSSWESGSVLPPVETFLFLCELYGVRDVLATFRGLEYDYPSAARLNEHGKSRVEEYIRLLSNDPMFAAGKPNSDINVVLEKPGRVIRLYDTPAAAGTGSFFDNDSYVDFEVDKTVPKQAEFAVRVSGDSMIPRFIDGQVIFIKKQQTLDIGEIGIFMLDSSPYIKKLGHGELLSLNSMYEPIKIYEHSSFYIFGKVVG